MKNSRVFTGIHSLGFIRKKEFGIYVDTWKYFDMWYGLFLYMCFMRENLDPLRRHTIHWFASHRMKRVKTQSLDLPAWIVWSTTWSSWNWFWSHCCGWCFLVLSMFVDLGNAAVKEGVDVPSPIMKHIFIYRGNPFANWNWTLTRKLGGNASKTI